MTRARAALLLTAALSFAACHPIAWAEGDDCPPDTSTTTTTTTPTVTSPPSTTVPVINGPADPIPQPHAPLGDVCIDSNGDGVGSTAQSLMVCFTTPEAELWSTTVWSIARTYQVSIPTANAMLVALLTGA